MRQQMTSNHYVYSHLHPDTGECFYIGIGDNTRVKDGRSGRSDSWNKYTDESSGFKWKILISGITRRKALEFESKFISQIGIENLVNTDHSKYYILTTPDGDVHEGLMSSIIEKAGISKSSMKRIASGKLVPESKFRNYELETY